ncbi:hypothetical protein GOP47_0010702 [Adiantum capillus-veneris]|uniref:DDE Tnp4 domain-containing protein n=1 Tax=Adiantum capillus-veneris TaxID=13818 RepID=A0A9D4ZIZ4_ADICA|nr:hypothetical protein GOP47_0010702 [Adiantum capillus-veneris]
MKGGGERFSSFLSTSSQSLTDLIRKDVQQEDIPARFCNLPGRIFIVEKKVAISVMVLVFGSTHYHVANAFGCGRSTVTTFIHKFVRSLVHRGGHLIKWPTTESEMRDVKDGFRALRGMPNYCGAIDCTHINMDLSRNEQSEPWRDRYGNYNMILQGIRDSNMRFLNVNVGWPRSCNGKRVLRSSGMYRLCQGGDCLKGTSFDFHEFIQLHIKIAARKLPFDDSLCRRHGPIGVFPRRRVLFPITNFSIS